MNYIKYIETTSTQCLTDCPHGQNAKVGSSSCKMCEYHLRQNEEFKEVECNAETFV